MLLNLSCVYISLILIDYVKTSVTTELNSTSHLVSE